MTTPSAGSDSRSSQPPPSSQPALFAPPGSPAASGGETTGEGEGEGEGEGRVQEGATGRAETREEKLERSEFFTQAAD